MSAELINLRKARKKKQRAEKKVRAEENRVKFGQPSTARAALEAQSRLQQRRLDGFVRDQSRINDEDDRTP